MSFRSTRPPTDLPWTSCPSSWLLRSYEAGTLGPQELRQLETHIGQCSSCEQTLSLLAEESDTLVRALAMLPPSADDEVAFQQLHAQLCEQEPEQPERPDHWSALLALDDRLADAPANRLALPYQLGSYELLAALGEGATGTVYKARHLKLDRLVAVKVLHPQHRPVIDEFLQEMKVVGQLQDPHIIRGTDAGEFNGLHYLVMEYVGGWDVSRLLDHAGPLQVADACAIIVQAAQGLATAHQAGMIHRDVKPSNLLISRQGHVRLLDLGLVRLPQSGVNAEELPRGTADYMAPEQWQTNTTLTPSVDIYGLGCTFYKLLTGHPPFRGQGKSRRDGHLNQQPAPIREVRPDCPVKVESLVRAMLAKTAAARPANCQEVIRQLAPWAQRAQLSALARVWIPQDPDVVERPTPVVLPQASAWTRRGWIAGSGSAAVAAALWLGRPFRERQRNLRTDLWRPLLASSQVPPLWLTGRDPGLQPAAATFINPQQLRASGSSPSLWELGRPVAAPFRLRTTLQFGPPTLSAGWFCAGQVVFDRASQSPHYQFHLVTVQREPATVMWQYVHAAPHQAWTTIPLAHAPLANWREANDLEVLWGQQGFPTVFWNGTALHSADWQRQFEASHYEKLLPEELQRKFLGTFGLYHSQGETHFVNPELRYEVTS